MTHGLRGAGTEHAATLPRPPVPPAAVLTPAAPAPVAPAPAAPTAVAPAPAGAQTVHTDNWPLGVLVISIGAFMSILDISIVNVAIPTMRNDFGVSTVDIEWVATAYSLALGAIVPVSGWLGERFGLGRVYGWAVLGFGLASALCGLAWDLPSEVVFRILQAVPGGILPVITLTMLYRMVPPDKIPLGMAAYGVSMVFAPALGPTLGGYLVEYHSWQWIFFINVPFGLIGAFLAFTVLPRFPLADVGRFDVWGFVTIAGGLFALLLALSKSGDWGWDGYRVRGLLVAGVLLIALFVVVELEVERPLLDVRLFRIWSFTNSLVLVGIMSSAFFTVLFYIPLFMQEGQGITPVNTGLAMFPEAVAMGVSLPVAGLLYMRMGARWPVVIGVLTTGLGTYFLTGISSDLSRWDVVLWTSFRGMGQACCMVPLLTAGLAGVPSDRMDAASAINNVMQRVTGALGLALMTTFVTANTAQTAADWSSRITDQGMRADPRLTAMTHDGVAGLLPYYQLVQLKIQAQAYSDLFLVLAVVTSLGALLGLFFSGKRPDPGSPMHLDLGG
jgi:EmrB/QacA subfamily drug resistance transporter